MTATAVAHRLGGEKILGRDVRSNIDLAQVIADGLACAALEFVMQRHDLDPAEVYALIGTRRTLTRKCQSGAKLSAAESDRLARVMRIVARAEEALGEPEKARRWLRKENRALGGARPLDLLTTDPGALLVDQLLGRIEHGIVS